VIGVQQLLEFDSSRALWDEVVSPGKVARLKAAGEPPPQTDVETRDPAGQRLDAFRRWVSCGGEIVMGHLRSGVEPEEAIDCVFDSDDWRSLFDEYVHWAAVAPAELPMPETVQARFPWAMGNVASPPTRKLATRCVELLSATFIAHEHLQHAGYTLPHSTGSDDSDPLWFLSDPVVPAALRTAMLHHRRAAVAVVSTYPYTRPTVRQDKFKDVVRLIEFAKDSLEKYLRTLANIPEAGVTIVEPDEGVILRNEDDLIEPFRVALKNGLAIGATSS
jgi:hypothetical protein